MVTTTTTTKTETTATTIRKGATGATTMTTTTLLLVLMLLLTPSTTTGETRKATISSTSAFQKLSTSTSLSRRRRQQHPSSSSSSSSPPLLLEDLRRKNQEQHPFLVLTTLPSWHEENRGESPTTVVSTASVCLLSSIVSSRHRNNNNNRHRRRFRWWTNKNNASRQNKRTWALSAWKSGGNNDGGGAAGGKTKSLGRLQITKPLQRIPINRKVQFMTLLRVGIPSLLSGIFSFYAFPFLSLTLATVMNDAGVFAVLSSDSSQFVQNFLTVAGLLFSILVGQTYYFMYQQQEMVYYALFNEVTEAKSLLEQVALVCQGRSMYYRCLESISRYVQDDLKQLQADPAVLLSARPVDDPLESIMYMTSVGVPSTVYETVKSLRQARASRLGALQRKLPAVHLSLLWILAAIELVSFPLLGAGTQTIGGYTILTVEGCLFGVMTTGIVLTLCVVGELWRPAGGAYNVDTVLSVMVSGLERELQMRMAGNKVYKASMETPSGKLEDVSKNMYPSSASLPTTATSKSATPPSSS